MNSPFTLPTGNRSGNFTETDSDLIKGIADGNEKMFRLFFDQYLPKLFPYVLKFSKSNSGAQEIIQETFIRVWLYRDRIHEVEDLNRWVFKVASNECYSYLRKKVLTDKFSNPIMCEPEPADLIQEWQDSRDLKRLVSQAVNELPFQRQKIYRMSRDEGKSIPEIAAELGLSPNTVKNTLVASLKSIRETLEKAGVHWFLLLLHTQLEIFFLIR